MRTMQVSYLPIRANDASYSIQALRLSLHAVPSHVMYAVSDAIRIRASCVRIISRLPMIDE